MNHTEVRELYMQCIRQDPRLDIDRVARVLESMLDALYAIIQPSVRDYVDGTVVEDLPDRIEQLAKLCEEEQQTALDADARADKAEARADKAEATCDELRATLAVIQQALAALDVIPEEAS